MSGLASCAACGAFEPGDALVEAVIVEESPAGEPITDAVVSRCAAKVAQRIDNERVLSFAPLRHNPVLSRSYALHEAGHAVVGLALGAKVRAVNIDTAVHCEFASFDGLSPIDRAAISVAGHAVVQADQRIRTHVPASPRFCAQAARTGRKRCDSCHAMRAIASTMPDGTDDDWLDGFHAAVDRAVALVRRPPIRAAIEGVADALVERGHLTGAEVEAIAGLMPDHGDVSSSAANIR